MLCWGRLGCFFVRLDESAVQLRVFDEMFPVFVCRQDLFLPKHNQQRFGSRNCNVDAQRTLHESEAELLVLFEMLLVSSEMIFVW